MSRTLITAAVFATFAGCAGSDAELPPGEAVALDAAMRSLDPHRTAFVIEDEALRELGEGFVVDAWDQVDCGEHRGVVGGLWYEDGRWEGAWFEIGTGALGGTVEGTHAEDAFAGQVAGADLAGDVAGWTGEGTFVGDWQAIHDDGGADAGQVAGLHERRNDVGGYFFGGWTDGCDDG